MPRKKATSVTPSSVSTNTRISTSVFVASLLFAGFVVIGGAVYIGTSDTGEINVSAAITDSNQTARNSDGDSANQVGVVPETFRNMTNGGLVPTSNTKQPSQAEMIDENTASSTEASESDSVEASLETEMETEGGVEVSPRAAEENGGQNTGENSSLEVQ